MTAAQRKSRAQESLLQFALYYLTGMDEATLKKAMRLIGAHGGFATAAKMTKAQKMARAKKASAAAAKARAKKRK